LAIILAAPEQNPFTPRQDALAGQVLEAMKQGDRETARRVADQLVQDAPRNPRAWRVRGLIEAQFGSLDEAETALTKALDLGIDRERSVDVHATLGYVQLRKGHRWDANRSFQQALSIDPNHPGALGGAAWVKVGDDDFEGAYPLAQKLVQVMPGAVEGHLLLAQILLKRDDAAGVRAEIEKLKQGGFADAEVLAKLEEAAAEVSRRALIWEVPLAVVMAMAAAVVLLFAAGTVLSRLQVARLSDVHAHLSGGEQTASERWMLRIYGAVLWFGTIFFYVSVPAMVVISLGTGFGLVYAIFAWLPAVPVQLVLFLLVAAVGGAWAVLRSLFHSAPGDTSGVEIGEAAEPRLFGALREVADAAGSGVVDRVFLEPDAGMAVRESGGAFRVLLGGGKRVLHLGFWVMQGLTVSELKSILAHEYGHFAHGETRLTPVIGRLVNTMVGTLQRMASLGRTTWINPVYWYLRLYFPLFYAVSAGQSRRRELLADRVSALHYGGATFGRALQSAIDSGTVFDGHVVRLLAILRTRGRPCTDLYACLRAAQAIVPERLRREQSKESLERAPGKYDSHPPPQERIARVADVEGRRAVELEPAFTLLADPGARARELTAILTSQIDARIEDAPAAQPMEPVAQETLAAGISLFDSALGLQGRGDAEGDALVGPALERIEAALGPEDPILVEPLKNLSRAHLRLGRKPEAEAALVRAIALAKDPDQLGELNRMLGQIRAAA